jgi:polysaccharide export outer membrane protein
MIFRSSDFWPRRGLRSARVARLCPRECFSRGFFPLAFVPGGVGIPARPHLCRLILLAAAAILLPGCAGVIQSSGPSASSVKRAHPEVTGIQVVKLTDDVASRLAESRAPESFPEGFRSDAGPRDTVEPGDEVEVMIMEAPPASLFGSANNGISGSSSVGAQSVTFPDQYISSSGIIYLPFAGEVPAAGKSLQQIEDEITDRLKGKANQPQVLVRLVSNNTDYVTVLGAGSSATRMPLTPARERLLDALSKAGTTGNNAGAAGGGGGDMTSYMVQVTRGSRCIAVPLAQIIREPGQNILLRGGDVITVMHQPYSFTVMGATGRNSEIRFEGPYITLAQAMARSLGLNENQANIRGVFVFRFEAPDALDWPSLPVMTTPNGKVRAIYWLDLSKPEGFFAAKTFPVRDGDLIYAAHAPAVGLQKLLSVVGSVVSPALGAAANTANVVNVATP